MPITKELENIRKFESVGFSHEQAETLTDVIENALFDGQQSLKDFINDKFEEFRAEMNNKFKDVHNEFKDVRNEITSSELRTRASHTDLLVKIPAIAAGCTTIGIAISRVWK